MKARLTSVAAVAATVAMGFVGVAGASAAEFEGSPEGNALKTVSNTTQVFAANATSGGAVECEVAHVSGKAVKNSSETVKVSYSECSADGFPGAEVGEAEYTFSVAAAAKGLTVTPGTATVDNEITIKDSLVGCTVTVAPAKNAGLSKVEFENKGSDLLETTDVTGVTDHVSGGGGLCGPETENTNGKYTGTTLVGVEEGTASVN